MGTFTRLSVLEELEDWGSLQKRGRQFRVLFHSSERSVWRRSHSSTSIPQMAHNFPSLIECWQITWPLRIAWLHKKKQVRFGIPVRNRNDLTLP